jgi:hypothetical protein
MNKGPNCHPERSEGSAFLFVAEQHPVRLQSLAFEVWWTAMGYSPSWAALKAGNLEAVCSALGLRATGKREEHPECKVTGAALPTGWYAILFNRSEIKDKP